MAEWNKDHPTLAITAAKKQGKLDGEESGDDDSESEKNGDKALQQLSRFRGLMLGRQVWPATLIDFERRWTEYKRENGLLDFTDLIETCYRDVYAAPKNPSVIFADEAQDLNRMQLSLVRKWGERANYFIVAGDDDQTMYSFSGATPEAFLDPDIPDDHKIILKQWYRVPRAVHTVAEGLIRAGNAAPGQRVPAASRRRRTPPAVAWRLQERGVRNPQDSHGAPRARPDGDVPRLVLVHAPAAGCRCCGKQGIPFHNPYRKSNGFWNPIRIGKRGSTASRILALLSGHPDFGEDHRPWTHGDLAAWAEVLQAKGILRHGVKAKLKTYEPAQRVSFERLDEIFEPDTLESLMRAWDCGYRDLLEWWRTRVTADVSERVKFPSDVTATRGPRALLETPKVVVGTIHSV